MHLAFDLVVYNPDIEHRFVTQVQVFAKGKAGAKRLLSEGIFSCKNDVNSGVSGE
jgi:hypothetical protein